MPAKKPITKKSKEQVVDRIADVFRRYGYDGASLGLISKAAGLGRASLYHHFPGGKEEMAQEVFGQVGRQVDKDMLAPLKADGSAQSRLANWIKGINRFYAGGCKNCLIGTMVLGGGSDRFSKEIATTIRTLIDVLGQVLKEAGLPARIARKRAEIAVGQIQGALVVCRGLGDEKHFQRVLKGLPGQLLAKE